MTAPFPLYTTDLIHLSSPLLIVSVTGSGDRVVPGTPVRTGIRLFCNGSIKKRPTVWGYNEYFFLIRSKWNVVKVFVYYHSISAKPNLHIFGIEVNLHKIFILSTAYILDHGKVCYPDQSKSVQERNSEDIPSPSGKGPGLGARRIPQRRTSPEKEIKVILFSVPV